MLAYEIFFEKKIKYGPKKAEHTAQEILVRCVCNLNDRNVLTRGENDTDLTLDVVVIPCSVNVSKKNLKVYITKRLFQHLAQITTSIYFVDTLLKKN